LSVLNVEDLVSAEMPEPGEVDLFDLDADVPILVVTRITTDATTGYVLEFTQVRLPANRSLLRYLV
jgi:DNA-binding GntR family transcriptional regulator